MIDQAGNKLEANKGYTLTFYYHSDTEIKQTNDLSKTGLYTVVARPNQANYKSGVTMKFEVVNDATTYTPAAEPKPSTLITISNTAELYGNTGNTGVQTSFTNSATLFKIEYQNGANWTKTRPTDAGRYLLKVTATTGDVALRHLHHHQGASEHQHHCGRGNLQLHAVHRCSNGFDKGNGESGTLSHLRGRRGHRLLCN